MEQNRLIACIERATAGDMEALRVFAEHTFRVAYEHNNDPANFEAYVKKHFSPAQFQAEFAHRGSEFWIAWIDETLAGFCKLNLDNTLGELAPGPTLEIERIYVSPAFQGNGLGGQLMDFCKQRTLETGSAWLWLGVWEYNPSAIAFYRKNGLEVFGTHEFLLGDDRQTDLMMRWKAG